MTPTRAATGDGGDAPTVLFDGECSLCNAAVRFILAREHDHDLKFASLRSDAGEKLCRAAGLDPTQLAGREGSLVYVTRSAASEPHALVRSDAVLAIACHLRAPWRWAAAGWIVPRSLRDAIYRVLARHRHRLFGAPGACPLPTAEHRDRFLG